MWTQKAKQRAAKFEKSGFLIKIGKGKEGKTSKNTKEASAPLVHLIPMVFNK